MAGTSGFDAEVQEVRLGLVCYGGVSLAIYMHGVSKELFKLVRAARAFDAWYVDRDAVDPFAGDPAADTESAYLGALKDLAGAGRPLTVAVDVVAGTSAGGINGVCLARGLATNRLLDGFRDLWLDRGDLKYLLAEDHGIHLPGLYGAIAEAVLDVAVRQRSAPLDGDRMSHALYEAFRDMPPAPDSEPPLVRPDSSIDLFTTTTSVHGSDTAIPSGAGGRAPIDRNYRQLLRFHYAAGQDDGDFDDVGTLAFAARTTSSFPGAFPPLSAVSFAASLSANDVPVDELPARIPAKFLYASEFDDNPQDQWYMDGGVLDNGPFDHVIEAVAAKRASGPTAREIVYLEPAPGGQPGLAAPADAPSVFATVRAAMLTVPGHAPFVSAVTRLRELNDAISEVGSVVAAAEPGLLTLLGADVTAGHADYAAVTAAAADQRTAAERGTLGAVQQATYCRLRADGIALKAAEALAAALGFPARSNRAAFLAEALVCWTRTQQQWNAADPAQLDATLGRIDLAFRERRAEFVLLAINQLFAARRLTARQRADLVAMKQACWTLLVQIRRATAEAAAAARAAAAAVFGAIALPDADVLGDPAAFAADRADGLETIYRSFADAAAQVAGSSQPLWDALRAGTEHPDWDEHRAALLSRYAGFPTWDMVVYPVVALAKLPQLSPIALTRFSPLDATALTVPPRDDDDGPEPPPKLAGLGVHHFGAFFKREYRENDYLWGRLDGAELILRLLARRAAQRQPLDGPAELPDLTGRLRAALRSTLAAERPALSHIGDLIDDLDRQAAALADGLLT